jgi:hypothetical protein
MKELLIEWRKYNTSINEMSRVWTQDASKFDNASLSAAAASQSNDRTNLSFKDFIKEMIQIVEDNSGKDLFVSFVDEYDDDTPRLGVSPKIEYDTPHGVYGYPLNNMTVYNLLTTGQPTSADFAADREYMHVYSLSKTDSIKINSDFSTNYDDSKFDKDVYTISKMSVDYILPIIDKYKMTGKILPMIEDNGLNPTGIFADFIKTKRIENIQKGGGYTILVLSLIYNLYIRQRKNAGKIAEELKQIVIDFSLSEDNQFKDRGEQSKFYQLYYIARFCSNLCEGLGGDISIKTAPAGGMFTLLLDGIGIKSIDDSKGTSTLHTNEPSQSVAFDTKKIAGENESYNLIGTYLSPASYFESISKIKAKEIIDNLLASGEISIDTVFPEGVETAESKATKGGKDKLIKDVKSAINNLTSSTENSVKNVIEYLRDNLDNTSLTMISSIIGNLAYSINENHASYWNQLMMTDLFKYNELKNKLGLNEQIFFDIALLKVIELLEDNQFMQMYMSSENNKNKAFELAETMVSSFAYATKEYTDDTAELVQRYDNILSKLNESKMSSSNILKEYIKLVAR